MLKIFEVENFRGFSGNFIYDLSKTKNYEFNEECIKNNIVNKSIIYGENGCGKSNLGLAIFDISGNLTDNNIGTMYHENYINANSTEKNATFRYLFSFQDTDVEYKYTKSDFETITSETLLIGGEVVIEIQPNSKLKISLDGAETLNRDLDGEKKMSALRYVYRNSKLTKTKTNLIFKELMDFVEGMLYFRSLTENSYIGLTTGRRAIFESIVENGNLESFQKFLDDADMKLKIDIMDNGEKKNIGIKFSTGKIVPMGKIASTGTLAISLFYYWYQNIDKIKFLFVDEFDAFYHHALAKYTTQILKNTSAQTILTTHNTGLMTNDIFRPDCCFIMDHEKISPIFERTNKELRQAHNIEKIYVAGGFDENRPSAGLENE